MAQEQPAMLKDVGWPDTGRVAPAAHTDDGPKAWWGKQRGGEKGGNNAQERSRKPPGRSPIGQGEATFHSLGLGI